jgi:hypothetical protein
VWIWLRSPLHGQAQLAECFYGETKPGLSLEQVKAVWVNVPSLAEQHEIVRRVEALFKLADAIERRVGEAQRRVERITQAVLAKAFRGELVPTEAELARLEGREYESAEQLLARVRAEKANLNNRPARRSRSSTVKAVPTTLIPCIYCERPFDPTIGEGDHVLPSGTFGEFRGDRRFRGACRACNNSFSPSEQVLAQGTPLGFYRQIVQPTRRRQGRGLRGTRGARRPEFRAEHAGWTILVHPDDDDPRNCGVYSQIVVRDSAGHDHPIPLYPNMPGTRLRQELDRAGIEEVREAVILCSEEEYDYLCKMLQAEFPTSRLEPPESLEEPTGQQLIRGEFSVSVAYFQALAKIAFHYYLVHNRRGYRGSEPAFQPIRDFIRAGGDRDQFFHSGGRTLLSPIGRLPNGNRQTAAQWSHWLGAVEDAGSAVVHLQFFAGPEYAPEPTFVTVGEFPSRVIVPGAAWGHVFLYDDTETGRFSGRVVDAEMTRFPPAGFRRSTGPTLQ